MNISVVIPLFNEAESLPELQAWIARVMQNNNYSYEIIFVDDGSTDDSWQVIQNLQQENTHIKGIKFTRNFGKSQALNAAFKQTKAEVVITMDADLQDSPDEIPSLYQMVKEQGYDIVSGWKQKRFDNKLTKNLPSKLFNWAARKTSNINLNDFNCGLKAYKATVVKNIDIYGEMHRYVPVLAKNAGYTNITEKIVTHQARKHGVSKFGASRFIYGFLDLISLWFIGKFGKRPMHFFGAWGTFMFLISFILLFGILGTKLVKIIFEIPPYTRITDTPWFYIILTTMLIGTQLFLAGFIGEIFIQQHKKQEDFYTISKFLNFDDKNQ